MKRIKNAVSLALALALCVSLAAPASAADSDFTIEDGILTEYNGPGGHVVIPDGVVEIGMSVFLMSDAELTGVTIPDSVTTIGDNAFRFCTGLTSVALPDSVSTIGMYAFFGCDDLKSVIIPASVTSIHSGAFTTHIDSAEYSAIPGLTIYGAAGSYAETYAREWNVPFVAIVGSFQDVTAESYYASAVAWAVEDKITLGTTLNTFTPGRECSHAEILTFLWRAADEPESKASAPIELKGSEFYAGAVRWAAEKGMIGSGFDPNKFCTRAEAVNYIWQAFDKPSAKASSFTDVAADSAYAGAVSWAVEKGVTLGTAATTFTPGRICNRGEIVTFLYRAYNN